MEKWSVIKVDFRNSYKYVIVSVIWSRDALQRGHFVAVHVAVEQSIVDREQYFLPCHSDLDNTKSKTIRFSVASVLVLMDNPESPAFHLKTIWHHAFRF